MVFEFANHLHRQHHPPSSLDSQLIHGLAIRNHITPNNYASQLLTELLAATYNHALNILQRAITTWKVRLAYKLYL